MNTTPKIEIKQREHLVGIIERKRDALKAELRKKHPYSEHACLIHYVKQKGFSDTLAKFKASEDKISTLRDELESHKNAIERLGISVSSLSSFSQSWNAPEDLRDYLADERAQAEEPVNKATAKHDQAIANVWVATNVEQLCKAIEGLI